ncbi:MAG TPA: division/cell wall cluster transcriptional repressor MraZ [Flavobacteriales bacterium]
MLKLLGEYPVKLDNKGRLLFPAKLRKALEGVIHAGLVINRDIYNKCLVLYPQPTWERTAADLDALNPYSRKHQEFVRFFLNGATELELDGVGRLNIPSHLLAYAGIDLKKSNEVIVCGMGQKIEIWSKEVRDEKMENPDFNFEELAEEVQRDIRSIKGKNAPEL